MDQARYVSNSLTYLDIEIKNVGYTNYTNHFHHACYRSYKMLVYILLQSGTEFFTPQKTEDFRNTNADATTKYQSHRFWRMNTA